MKKFKNSLLRIYVPIIAQIFLAVVSYRILSMMTFNPNRVGSDDSTVIFVTVKKFFFDYNKTTKPVQLINY